MLSLVLRPQEEWAQWSRLLKGFASRIQTRCIQEVISHHRARAASMGLEQQAVLADSVARALRRAAKACPDLPSIGIPPASEISPPSFFEWIDPAPTGPVRTATPAAGPMSKLAQWNPSGEVLDGVVCCARAEGRVRVWRKGANKSPSAPPPRHLLKALVHQVVLPTAVASKPDHWWLVKEQRWMSVLEVCRAFGLRDESPLTRALCSEVCPASAVQVAGKAIHAGIARLLVDKLDAEGLLPSFVRYASSCSGADFFAEAVDCRRAGRWAYVHAAEADPTPRKVLGKAWCLGQSCLFRDASSAEARDAPECDLFVFSPDCVDFSRRRHGRDEHTLASGAMAVSRMLGFISERKAAIVVVENVDEPDGVGAITDLLAEMGGYSWRSQALDSLVHAGAPVRRRRHFWLGVRV